MVSFNAVQLVDVEPCKDDAKHKNTHNQRVKVRPAPVVRKWFVAPTVLAEHLILSGTGPVHHGGTQMGLPQ